MPQKSQHAKWHDTTQEIHAGVQRTPYGETSDALFLTSGFIYDNAQQAADTFTGKAQHYQYSRISNPTLDALNRRLCLLEGAQACMTTATGMSAVFAALGSTLSQGDRIVASKALFGSSYHIISTILPRFGVDVTWVEGTDLAAWEKALQKPAKMVHLETPSNPMLDILDIKEIARLAHQAGAMLAVDNVMATPIFQKPLELGADIVIYSATKHMDGQGRVLGGAVLGKQEWVNKTLKPFITNTGNALSPFNGWVLLKGLETLSLRVKRMSQIALDVAQFLEKQTPLVEAVYYPFLKDFPQYELAREQMTGGGSVLSFDIKGGRDAAFTFMDHLNLIQISNNLGDVRTLITHPATTTHSKIDSHEREKLGITESTLRLTVGLEDPHDLEGDIHGALKALA